jgi:hypothetical protein
VVADLAKKHPAWGHRKIWAMARHAGHQLTMSTVLRVLRDEGLLLEASYQRERRRLAAERKAAFCDPPTGPNQVWQFDFSEYETSRGGTWRTAGVADYWSKYEFGWHWSPTANQHDAVAGVELAIAEATRLLGASLLETLTDAHTGEVTPVVLVTDNGGPFRSFRIRRVHHRPSRASARSHPSQDTRPKRRPGAGVRVVEVRAALPRGHPRRA